MLSRRFLLLVPLLFLPLGAPRAAEVTGAQVAERTERVLKAIEWAGPLSVVEEKARREKKLVFWLQLVGDLDGGL